MRPPPQPQTMCPPNHWRTMRPPRNKGYGVAFKSLMGSNSKPLLHPGERTCCHYISLELALLGFLLERKLLHPWIVLPITALSTLQLRPSVPLVGRGLGTGLS